MSQLMVDQPSCGANSTDHARGMAEVHGVVECVVDDGVVDDDGLAISLSSLVACSSELNSDIVLADDPSDLAKDAGQHQLALEASPVLRAAFNRSDLAEAIIAGV